MVQEEKYVRLTYHEAMYFLLTVIDLVIGVIQAHYYNYVLCLTVSHFQLRKLIVFFGGKGVVLFFGNNGKLKHYTQKCC